MLDSVPDGCSCFWKTRLMCLSMVVSADNISTHAKCTWTHSRPSDIQPLQGFSDCSHCSWSVHQTVGLDPQLMLFVERKESLPGAVHVWTHISSEEDIGSPTKTQGSHHLNCRAVDRIFFSLTELIHRRKFKPMLLPLKERHDLLLRDNTVQWLWDVDITSP